MKLRRDIIRKLIKEQIDEMCGVNPMMHSSADVPSHHDDDHEGSMAKRQMYKTAKYAAEIFDNIHDDEYDHVMGEKLDKDATAGDYVKDFRKSKAPQFKGKSKKKKQEMAIAAYLDAQEDK